VKKTIIILLISALLAAVMFAGCSSNAPEEPSVPEGQEANAWVVVEEASLMDGQGNTVGTVYPGFALTLKDAEDGDRASFTVAEMEDNGQDVKEEKKFYIELSHMQEGYVQPQAVVMMISGDMITLAPDGSLYDESGEKLITFTDGIGPMYYIQKTEQGYMFTLDMNVVYAGEDEVTVTLPS
jgi:hypothetical protein